MLKILRGFGPLPISVFLRAVLISSATAGLVAVLLSWQAARLTDQVAHDGLLRLAAEMTESLAAGTTAAIKFRKAEDIAAEARLAFDRSEGTILSILAFDSTGAMITTFPAVPGGDVSALQALAADALAGGNGHSSASGLNIVRLSLGKDGAPVGGIAIAWSDASLQAAIQAETQRSRAMALAAFVVLSALGALVLRSSISMPLRRVAQAMVAVGQGQFDATVPETARRDEIGALARELDRFRVDLGRADQAQTAAAEEQATQARVVDRLRAALADLASGNLAMRLEDAFPPAYQALRDDLNQFAATLSAAMQDVVQGAGNIRSGTEGLSRSTDDLARRTENQAATLEQSVAAIEELSGSIRSAAEDTRRVAEGVTRARAGRRKPDRGAGRGRRNVGDPAIFGPDHPHHWRDRRHFLSDQPAGPERRGRGGPRR